MSLPHRSCFSIIANGPSTVIDGISNECIHIWKQNDSAYVITRERLNGQWSIISLFMIIISDVDGKTLASKLMEKHVKLLSTVDYRVFGAFYHTTSKSKLQSLDQEMKDQDNESENKYGFPNEDFLMIISDTNDAGFRSRYRDSMQTTASMNLIMTQNEYVTFKNDVNLQCLWYHLGMNKFIGIERKSYHLISIGFNTEDSRIFVMDKYRKVASTGLQHYFFDEDMDTIVIYKTLMASSKFKNELIFLPVSSQLMLPDS